MPVRTTLARLLGASREGAPTLTRDAVAGLPRPDETQIDAFVDFVSNAYNWYKHLSLMDGAPFVIHLSPDAGRDPRMQWGRQRPLAEHRERFGHLDYRFRMKPGYDWEGDGSDPPLRLDDELTALGSVTVHPYAHDEFLWWEPHERDVARLLEGATHPDAEWILAAWCAHERFEAAEHRLTEAQHDRYCDVDEGLDGSGYHSDPAASEPWLREILALSEARRRSGLSLRDRDRARIRRTVARVAESAA